MFGKVSPLSETMSLLSGSLWETVSWGASTEWKWNKHYNAASMHIIMPGTEMVTKL